jgi:hypothetical protein
MGVHSTITSTFIPPNHASALQNPTAIDEHLTSKMAAGRISRAFTPAELEARIGAFRSLPLGTVPKGDSVQVIQDLLYDQPDRPAVNADINPDHYPCKWDGAAEMILRVMEVPSGSEGATLNVDAVF